MRRRRRSPEFDDLAGLRDAIEAVDQGFQIIGRDWRYRYVNAAAARHGRRSRDEFVGRTMMECYPGIDRTEVFRALEQCMTSRQPAAMENEFVYPDGQRAYFELFIQPCLEGVSVLSLNVTDRKRTAAGLRMSEKRFRAVVESSPSGLVMVDRDGTIILVNPEAERLFGYSHDELLGVPLERLVPDRFREGHPGFRAAFYGRPERRPMGAGREVYAQRKDGVEVPVEIGLTPIATDDGLFALATVVDISNRKHAELAVQRLAAIVESAEDAIVSMSLDGTLLTWNAAAERMFGYAAGETVGGGISRIVPRDRRAEADEILAGIRRGERIEHLQSVRLRKDGTRIEVSISVSPIRSATGKLIGASKILRDITHQKQMEEELRRSNEDLERFAYVASHDLQEPLRTVASYVQLLARRYGDKLDADAREFIDFAVQGAKRMQRLIDDLLSFSRVGRRGGAVLSIPADAALDAALKNLRASLDDAAATVTRDRLPRVRADMTQLEQLFTNLIGNALKFRGAAAPQIDIGARRDGTHRVFHVRDNGIGIDPQYFNRIFVIFQRLHGRDEFPGTGIGLAICKKIVERHGGRIWVESLPGRGATFFFTLPALPEA